MKDILPELNGKEYTEGIYNDYDIHFCRLDECEDLVDFLRQNWNKNHIFVKERKVLDFQHRDEKNNMYTYVLTREKNTSEIHSALGFVPTSQYDSEIEDKMIWPCIWKSRDDIKRKGLGVTCYHYLKSNIPINTISILGISTIALSIYKHWNFETGKIEQFALYNTKLDEVLSSGLSKISKPIIETDTMELKEISEDDFDDIDKNNIIFTYNCRFKSKRYFINRYYKHPVYKYCFFGIYDNKEIKSIFVCRVCGDGKSHNCIRIVDYLGNIKYLKTVKKQIQLYLENQKLEYIDFVSVGLDAKELKDAGFYNRNDYSDLILPNYFEPFLKENIYLDYAYKTVDDMKQKIFFKADADQDRPNIMEHK